MSATADMVVISIIMEARPGSDTATYTRAQWDAMTPRERRTALETIGDTAISNAGGWSVSIESGAPESDLDDPPGTPTTAQLLDEYADACRRWGAARERHPNAHGFHVATEADNLRALIDERIKP